MPFTWVKLAPPVFSCLLFLAFLPDFYVVAFLYMDSEHELHVLCGGSDVESVLDLTFENWWLQDNFVFFLNFHQEFRSKHKKTQKTRKTVESCKEGMQKGGLTSRLHRKPRLCCCRSSQRSVCSSLEIHWAALKQAAFTTHTQTDPVRSINRRRQRLTEKTNKPH